MQQANLSLIAVPNPIGPSPVVAEVLALGGQDFAQILGEESAATVDPHEPDLSPAADTLVAQLLPTPIFVPPAQLPVLQLPQKAGPADTFKVDCTVALPTSQFPEMAEPKPIPAPTQSVLSAKAEFSPAEVPPDPAASKQSRPEPPVPEPLARRDKEPFSAQPPEQVDVADTPPTSKKDAALALAVALQPPALAPARADEGAGVEPSKPLQKQGNTPSPLTDPMAEEKPKAEPKQQFSAPVDGQLPAVKTSSLPEKIPAMAAQIETLAGPPAPVPAAMTAPPMAVPFVAAQMAVQEMAVQATTERDVVTGPWPDVPIEPENPVKVERATDALPQSVDEPIAKDPPLPPLDLQVEVDEAAADSPPPSIAVPVHGQAMPVINTATPLAPPVYVTQTLPPQVAPDLVDVAKTAPDQGVDLILNPAELGQVRFEMAQRDGVLHVSLTVERPETLDLMRRNSDQLVQEFRQAGFGTTSFSFSGGGGSAGAGTGQGSWTPPPEDAARQTGYAMAEPILPARNLAPQSGLNLRL